MGQGTLSQHRCGASELRHRGPQVAAPVLDPELPRRDRHPCSQYQPRTHGPAWGSTSWVRATLRGIRGPEGQQDQIQRAWRAAGAAGKPLTAPGHSAVSGPRPPPPRARLGTTHAWGPGGKEAQVTRRSCLRPRPPSLWCPCWGPGLSAPQTEHWRSQGWRPSCPHPGDLLWADPRGRTPGSVTLPSSAEKPSPGVQPPPSPCLPSTQPGSHLLRQVARGGTLGGPGPCGTLHPALTLVSPAQSPGCVGSSAGPVTPHHGPSGHICPAGPGVTGRAGGPQG